MMNCRWYQQAIIYSLDVETFKDGNGDGIGDFQGLMESCSYLAGLGVNTLWLLPFYPSPNRDNGYDVMDYYGVDPRLGSLGDFVAFMNVAREHGLRVMVDLVLNHTSDQHPWFQQAREKRSSPYHDYYVWRYEPPPDSSHLAIFPPEQKGIWTHEKKVNGWYLHRFYKHQPDLNIANPKVRDEMKKIMGFWLELGVSGFRVDAVPYLVDLKGIHHSEEGEQYDYTYLEEFREYLSWSKGDAVLLAEANVAADKLKEYFGADNRMHMVLNFLLNQRFFLALAQKNPDPVRHYLENPLPVPEHGQWGMFLRNHDELSLDRLEPQEQEECYGAYAPRANMRIFGRGVRRRLAPILDGNQRKISLAFSLMLTMPGSPILWYGDEIGMGDDLRLEGRNSVRTPMQWSSEPNGGFSTAPARQLIRPVISRGDYGFRRLNVEQQERDPKSLFNALQQMIRVRRHWPEIGCGQCRLLKTNHDKQVLAHVLECGERSLAAVHNFSGHPISVIVDCAQVKRGVAVDILGTAEHPILHGQCRFELPPFGYRWYRMEEKG